MGESTTEEEEEVVAKRAACFSDQMVIRCLMIRNWLLLVTNSFIHVFMRSCVCETVCPERMQLYCLWWKHLFHSKAPFRHDDITGAGEN